MAKKKCKLCNRTYSYSYKLFGRGCLNSECRLLNIEIPKNEKNKEIYFCNEVARRLKKTNLSQSKKYDLAEKYLTLEYLKNIKYGDLSEEKEYLEKEIDSVSSKKSVKETIDKLLDNKLQNTIDNSIPSITLNKIYRIYKTTLKFSEKISSFNEELENAMTEKQKEEVLEKYLLEDLKFVFDITKIGTPIYYKVYYAMQVAVWEVVIAGGYSVGYVLAAELLQKSLVASNEIEEDYYVINEDRINKIKADVTLQNKIRKLLESNSENKLKKGINENNSNSDDLIVRFESGDIFYALHDATINIVGQKINNKWCLNVTLKDRYDFTNPKLTLEEYEESPLGSVLNNCGVISQQFGVIRPYRVYVEIQYDDFEKEVKQYE